MMCEQRPRDLGVRGRMAALLQKLCCYPEALAGDRMRVATATGCFLYKWSFVVEDFHSYEEKKPQWQDLSYKEQAASLQS